MCVDSQQQSEREKEVCSIAIVGLVNLQTSLLGEYVSNHLNCRFSIIKVKSQKIDNHYDLFLVDCSVFGLEEVRSFIDRVQHHHPDANVALLNVVKSSVYEMLAKWPIVNGIFYSDTSEAQLTNGLRELLNDNLWLPRGITDSLVEQLRTAPSDNHANVKLTRRENQILNSLANAATNKQIAFDLNVSEHTIKSHLYHIFKKIGVRNRLEAVNWITRN
jgi:LuxR family transcriptional regulator of csgAB operon